MNLRTSCAPSISSRAATSGDDGEVDTLTTLAELAAAGQLRVRIDAEVTLADVPATIARTRTGHATAKTIIII